MKAKHAVERAGAFVRPTPGSEVPSIDQVRHRLATAGIAKYKWPEEICCHQDDFPRTPAGKVRKTELRAIWAARAERAERTRNG
jgi:acyl-CoA synthetase